MPTAMITGANRGIGLELLRQYAQQGWRVLGTCRNPETASAAQALADAHDSVSLHALDVTDAAAVAALAVSLDSSRIDVLVLNAGVMSPGANTLGELDASAFLHVLEVNVVAPAICAQAFRRHVATSERRIIVGMGSYLGSIASNNEGGLYSYRSAKAGLHAIMRSLSVDLRDEGVTAIAMHPGWVQTDMGGPDASLSTEASVAGILRVIDGLKPGDSGRLLTYAGEELPW
ncbi:Short chain dehydrogenase [Pseudohaliea rubra DSM 19751]|uniref:Short chain dehydrogenase n=2 Tax=Pseudohaliea TaxID=1341120 RepID=A0A095XY19_9GAMM|nr:Short chain dehydrogenase [Pseudohaliea rubra DSM 19751]